MSVTKFKIDRPTRSKVLLNVGALMDIPTAIPITGPRGETIINGGCGNIVAVVGPGNSFKSTIANYIMLSAANKVAASTETSIMTYDSEVNISPERLNSVANKFEYLHHDPVFGDVEHEDPQWIITDKAEYAADEWYAILKNTLREKENNKSDIAEFKTFRDPSTKEVLKMKTPTFVSIDSLSEFESSKTIELMEKNIVDDSSSNMLFMQQGLFKTKVLAELPRMSSASNTYFVLTAHVGEKKDMRTGPAAYGAMPKDLQHMKADEKLKGVSSKFSFLTSSLWQATSVSLLKNPTTKLAEYPRDKDESLDTDLNIVNLKQLRSKTGTSGYILPIIVSQMFGVQPELTEFHYIKMNDRYGIDGNNTSYSLTIYPECKLGRTTVWTKIIDDSKLRRALNITSELLQLHKFHSSLKELGLLCTPKELYDDIIALGYDWDKDILTTRGWYTLDNYNPELPNFLSIIDLLKIRKGLYTPYWYKGK